MKAAIAEFKVVNKGLREVARAWNVPKDTLARRIKKGEAGGKHASGRKPILSPQAERELTELIMMLSKRGFPLRRKDVQRLAFEYAVEHGLSGFNAAKGSAGYYWFQGFLSRNPELSIKKPEALSVGRAMGMNFQVVSKWFDGYENCL